jgi:pimeloyl-ACP methyl ester carboxylesterase
MWDREFVALAAHHRVVRYDIRGHGLTQSPYGTYRNYQDLAALLDHLDVRRAHLIGLSLGCRIAVDLAIARPERVASLVLVSPGVSGYDFDAPEERACLQREIDAWMAGDFARAAEEFVRGWCDGPKRGPEAIAPEVRARVKAMALANVRPDRDLGQGIELDPPAFGRLGEIRAPTLAILGRSDMPGIGVIVDAIGAQVPGARVERLPGVAHLVNLERPRSFERLVAGFLRTQSRRDRR